MRGDEPSILYVGAKLPSRSETFVYREVIELRKRNISVATASVHTPEFHLGDATLDQLAESAIPIYGTGLKRLFFDALQFAVRRPERSFTTALTGLSDAVFGRSVRFSSRPKLLVQCLAGLALAHRIGNAEINHIHAHMAHVPTSIAMYAAQALAVPFSFTGHAADLFRDYSLLPAKLKRAKFVCCISYWHREYYQAIVGGLSDSRLPVVRCGVDTSVFDVSEKESRPATFKILAVGRLVEKKGFDTLIAACSEIARDDGKRFECTIVGDGPEASNLNQLIREKNLSTVIKMAGAKSNHEIRIMMEESDLFVLPCRSAKSGDKDGIPVVLMEAMASGVPVVSGDLVTIRELIQHEKNGLMVQPENVEELARTLTRLRDDPILRSRLSQAGRQQIEDEFSLSSNVGRLLEAIQQVHNPQEFEFTRTTLCPENTA